jgi:hypothetical protein
MIHRFVPLFLVKFCNINKNQRQNHAVKTLLNAVPEYLACSGARTPIEPERNLSGSILTRAHDWLADAFIEKGCKGIHRLGWEDSVRTHGWNFFSFA